MELKRYKLGDLMEVSRGTSLAGEFYATEGELIRLTLGNFDYQRGGFKHNTSKDNIYFSGKVKEEYILNEGDIITPLTEQTAGLLGSTARIPESGKYIQSQDVALIRCNEALLDPTFCYYLLPSASVKKQLGAAAQQTKIRHTTPDRIKEVIVDIPPLAEQKAIGKILDAITSKIELNYSINHYLEAMAKQLYDYWFVQFDFPDATGKPYKSSGGKMVWNEKLKREIPEGWELTPLFKGVDVQYGFPFSTDLFTEIRTEIPIVRIRDIMDGSTSAFYCGEVDDKYRLNKGDIVIGMDGNFHMNYWHSDVDYLNQRCVRLRPKSNSQISALQSLFETSPYIKAKEKNAKGSTVGHLSDKDLKGMWLIKPVSNVNFKPRETFDSLLNKMIGYKEELLHLTQCRNELLPLLMTGQVSVTQLNNDLVVWSFAYEYQYMTINTNINQCSHFNSLYLLFINPASNMANFLFYRYRFVPVEEVDMFMKQDESIEPSQYDEVHNPRFSEDLATKASGIRKLNLFQFKKDRKGVQTSVQYENDVLNYNSGVMMLQVRNNKHKKVIPIDKLDALDIPHYPYTLVIVDTRPDSQAILIQQKTSAFKNTEEVAKLVAEYCSRELKLPELGVAMCPQMRVCEGSIWDIVTMRTMKGQDRVKSFTLKLDKKRPNTKNEVDKALQLVLEMFCAPEGELKLSSKKEGAAIFDEAREDMQNVVDMLIQNKYHMKVGFEKSGTVEYGKETPAIYGLDDNVCLEFMKGEPHIGSGELGEYYLYDWLDMLIPDGSGYSYKQPQKKKRNGKRN